MSEAKPFQEQPHSIIMLGPSGSGKTTFLASMFEQLRVQSAETNFAIEAEDPAQRTRLTGDYGRLSRGELPNATVYSEISRWDFTCRVSTPRGNFRALRLNYYDYAGSRLTEVSPNDPRRREFDQLVQGADSVIGMIDGLRLLDAVGPRHDLTRLLDNVRAITTLMDSSDKTSLAATPVHFVITKWDLFPGGMESGQQDLILRQVRDLLLTIRDFRDFVAARTAKRTPIRLIPISSLGKGYMELRPDGSQRPIAGAKPDPYQVEMPLALSLFDRIREGVEQAITVYQQTERHPLKHVANLMQGATDQIGKMRATQIRKFLPKNFAEVSDDTIERGLRLIASLLEGRAEDLRKTHDAAMQRVGDQRSAFDYLLTSFATLESKLEREFPSSNLSQVARR